MSRTETALATGHWLAKIALLVVSMLVGCGRGDGRPARVPVSGIVRLGGMPVADASVIFYPTAASQPTAYARTGPEGRFRLTTYEPEDGAVPGSFVATISKTVADNEMSYQEGEAYFNRTGKPPPFPTVRQLLPSRYSSHQTSGLECTVAAGQPNEFALDLSPD